MNVLAISGKAGVGKTTLANIIAAAIPGTVRVAFADPLKQEVADLLGETGEYIHSPAFKTDSHLVGRRTMSGRRVLTWWGTEIRRAADPFYWDTRMADYLDVIETTKPPLVICDDLRFPTEIGVLGGYNTVTVRLEPYAGWEPGPCADHLSETALDDHAFDHTLGSKFGMMHVVVDEILSWRLWC